MTAYSQAEKSKLRIASLCAAHCIQHRLMPERDGDVDPQALLGLAQEVLDLFEDRFADLPSSATQPGATGGSSRVPLRHARNLPRMFPGPQRDS